MSPRTTRTTGLVLAFLSPLVLAACALVPTQTISDPLGIDGLPVELTPISADGSADVAAARATPQQAVPCEAFAGIATHCSTLAGGTFPDVEDDRFTGIVARFDTAVGLRDSVRLSGIDPAAPPERVAFTGGVLDLRIEDTGSGTTLDPEAVRVDPASPVVFERASCDAAALSCTYTAASTEALDIPFAFFGDRLDALLEILTEGGDNRLSGTLAYDVTVDGAEGAAFDVRVVLSSPEGTVHF